MFDFFGNKQFMRFEAQGFPSYPLINAYMEEEGNFKKHVKMVHLSQVPKIANIVNSHSLFKLKKLDDSSLKLKSRIAPHGNEDSDKDDLKTDCSMWPSFRYENNFKCFSHQEMDNCSC